jgi:hypothetical protein
VLDRVQAVPSRGTRRLEQSLLLVVAERADAHSGQIRKLTNLHALILHHRNRLPTGRKRTDQDDEIKLLQRNVAIDENGAHGTARRSPKPHCRPGTAAKATMRFQFRRLAHQGYVRPGHRLHLAALKTYPDRTDTFLRSGQVKGHETRDTCVLTNWVPSLRW